MKPLGVQHQDARPAKLQPSAQSRGDQASAGTLVCLQICFSVNMPPSTPVGITTKDLAKKTGNKGMSSDLLVLTGQGQQHLQED